MLLPDHLKIYREWVLIGPMGPELPAYLMHLPVMAIDGGGNHSKKIDIWVGDKDSLLNEISTSQIFQLPMEKDESDLSFGLKLLKDASVEVIHLWGFLGGRKDHELFNLGESLTFLESKKHCLIKFYGNESQVMFQLYSAGKWTIPYNGLFSLGSHKDVLVKLSGQCQYSIPEGKVIKSFSSTGLSNRAMGDIYIENNSPIFLYFPGGE